MKKLLNCRAAIEQREEKAFVLCDIRITMKYD